MRKGLTLVEVIISIIILGLIITAVYRSYSFFLNNIAFYLKRSDIHMEIDYAMENVRMHLLSASAVDQDSMFTAGQNGTKGYFNFTGEANYSNITPDNESDNVYYHYFVNQTGDFIVESNPAGKLTKETLVSGYLDPRVNFTYTRDTEPNFISVTISAGAPDSRINKTEGMRLWFVDVVQ